MGEFNVNKTTGELEPTAGYGGYIKKTGSTISELVTALNGMTEEQKARCVVTINDVYVLRCVASNSTAYHIFNYFIMSGNTFAVNEFRLDINTGTFKRYIGGAKTASDVSVTSWEILYQDDSPSGGNTYPATQVILSDGDTSVEDALTYSTTEHKVGKWIDGSDLYEKTIDFGTLPNNTTKSVSSGLSNVTVREIKGYAKSSTNVLMMPYIGTNGGNTINFYFVHSDNNKITAAATGNLSAYTECYITLRYTKNI